MAKCHRTISSTTIGLRTSRAALAAAVGIMLITYVTSSTLSLRAQVLDERDVDVTLIDDRGRTPATSPTTQLLPGRVAGKALPTTIPAARVHATTRSSSVQVQLEALVTQLSAEDWKTRQRAQDKLIEMGDEAVPELQNVLRRTLDDEVRTRVEAAIKQIRNPAFKNGILSLGSDVTMKFVLIPPGKFMMGSPPSEDGRDDNERQHEVAIARAFYMADTEVTQWQWNAVIGKNPSAFIGDGLPVERVSWDDARMFCEKVSRKTGYKVRLPTEAEWEYACRAETTGPFGGTEKLKDMGWCDRNTMDKTQRVGLCEPNRWGLYDMHGNVAEWCADWYGADPADGIDRTAALGDADRVVRGGSWRAKAATCRSASRTWRWNGSRSSDVGFRVVLEHR